MVKNLQNLLRYCSCQPFPTQRFPVNPFPPRGSQLTLSHLEVLPWWVKSSGVRQSNIIKRTVLAGLGGKGLRKRDKQIDPVNPFPPRGSQLTLSHPEVLPWQVKSSGIRHSKITKGTVLASLGEKGLQKDGHMGPVNSFPPRGSALTYKIIWH